jgi:tetratricopeptide (TPR) repeat protein
MVLPYEDPASRWEELHAALDEHTETGRWGDAADTLVALSDLETEPQPRARYLHAAGLICRDRVGDQERSAALFGVALVNLGNEGAEALRAQLWSGLGVTARNQGDRETALAAFAAAEALAPDEAGPVRHIAELHAESGDQTLAAAAYQRLVAHAPDDPAPYRALVRLWSEGGHPDRARWARLALEHLGELVPERDRSHAEAAEATPAFGATGTLDDEAWQRLAHPDEEQAVSAVFALIAPLCLGEVEEGVSVRLLERARATASLRPAWVLRHALPVSGLERALRSARVVSAGAGPEGPEDERLARIIAENLSRAELASLEKVTGALSPEVDVRRWVAASELSAARAALALTGDLAAVTAVVARDAAMDGVLPAAERIKDLLAFCVSEDHFAVRRSLGIGAKEVTSGERSDAP